MKEGVSMKKNSFEKKKLADNDEHKFSVKEKAALLTDEELEQAVGGGSSFKPGNTRWQGCRNK